jgi:ankyrin repeat protein
MRCRSIYPYPVRSFLLISAVLASAAFAPAANHDSNENERTELALAAENGEKERFRRLLEQRPYPNLNARGKDGRTALHLLAENDMLDEARALVKKGHELAEKAAAMRKAKKELPPDLAANAGGVAINARSDHKFTPLHIAARRDHKEAVRFLLSQGASPDACDRYGQTPLHSAAQRGYVKTASMLRGHGAGQARDARGRLPLHYAAMEDHVEVAKMLLASPDYDEFRDKKGLTPLHYAAKRGNPEMAQLLLRSQSNDATDDLGLHPLHYAVANGHDKVVAVLLKEGIDVNMADERGRTPLDLAEQDNIRKLLEDAGGEHGKDLKPEDLATGDTTIIEDAAAADGEGQALINGEIFDLMGRKAFIMHPAKGTEAAEGTPQPWVFYAPALPRYPDENEKAMHQQFLDAGIAVAGIDVGNGYGSPLVFKYFEALWTELVDNRGFSAKAVCLARSRGGLWASSWAIAQPDRIGGIAGIYPAFDYTTYPGVDKAAPAYGVEMNDMIDRVDEFNPIRRAEVLAKAKIPVFMLHGDADSIIPLHENSAALKKVYYNAGVKDLAELAVVPNQGHSVWEGYFSHKPLIDFVIKHAKGCATKPATVLKPE